MKNVIRSILIIELIFLVFIPKSIYAKDFLAVSQVENPQEGWAAILEMNDFPDAYSDVPTNYSDTKKWISTLKALGWREDHMYILNGAQNRSNCEDGVDFLIKSADENDIVVFYILSHGGWLQYHVEMLDWFPSFWDRIPTQNKLAVVSACRSEKFIDPLKNGNNSYIGIASSKSTELSWAGIEEEGLPIIGEVMNHYFTAAFLNKSADNNNDGDVSVEEAFDFSYTQIRDYYNDVIFPAFPIYAMNYNYTAPHPVMEDFYPDQLSISLEKTNPENDEDQPNPENNEEQILGIIILVGLIGGISLTTTILLLRKHRRK
jgi:hypothetical protein